jgi:hypothetical protein
MISWEFKIAVNYFAKGFFYTKDKVQKTEVYKKLKQNKYFWNFEKLKKITPAKIGLHMKKESEMLNVGKLCH